ncbi:MAG: hypothetical protein D6731_08370 [Planctomycetota bacterium]|nr:MAG: hypothetical protein D6731_08370 [Planctomycetota bacterium]
MAPVLYGALALWGAFLLFWLELLAARLLLPRFGGAAAVWTTSLLSFQALLLCGVGLAHGAQRAGPRVGPLCWLLPLLGGAAVLPLALVQPLVDPAAQPVLALLEVLLRSLGLPFVALATTAPLLQSWFARRALGRGGPYGLYVASNAGSFLALLAFPFLFEPCLGLEEQRVLWSLGYGVWACGVLAFGAGNGRRRRPPRALAAVPPVPWRVRGRWALRSFLGCALLYGLTTTLGTDLVAFPLLWVVPLGLYLLSFVLSFRGRRWVSRERAALLLAPVLFLLLASALIGLWQFPWPRLLLVAHALGVFGAMLFLHRDLYGDRPPAEGLTSFYAWIACGGLAAGVCCALLAPFLLRSVAEYPLALLLSLLLLPGGREGGRGPADRWLRRLLWLEVGALLALLLAGFSAEGCLAQWPAHAGVLLVAVLVRWCLQGGGGRAALYALLGSLCLQCALVGSGRLVLRGRSFYGTHAVIDSGALRSYLSGSTVHGQRFLDDAAARRPVAYYARSAPLGELFSALPDRPRRVAVLGLGVGGLLPHARPGDLWRFYELDPWVVELARGPLFGYVRNAPASVDIHVGDGRLLLGREQGPPWDVLVMDAFSSDAVPVHLLTTEAFALYLRRLAPEGLLVLNVSNRVLDLEPLVAAQARRLGLVGRARRLARVPAELRRRDGAARSHCVVLARRAELLAFLGPRWRALPVEDLPRPWTDDRVDLLAALAR